MKRLLLCISLLYFGNSFSQSIYIGPELGMNLIEMKSDTLGKWYQPAWFGGGVLEYRFNKWIAIKTGVNYAQKRKAYAEFDTIPIQIPGVDLESLGLSGVDLNTYYRTEGISSQHYLEIPILAKLSYKDFYFAAGWYQSFRVSSRNKEFTVTNTPLLQTFDLASFLSGLGVPPEFAFFLPPDYKEEYAENSDGSAFKWFDYGFRGNIGFQSDHFGFCYSYQVAIPDYRKTHDWRWNRHHYMTFSINYLFGVNERSGGNRSL